MCNLARLDIQAKSIFFTMFSQFMLTRRKSIGNIFLSQCFLHPELQYKRYILSSIQYYLQLAQKMSSFNKISYLIVCNINHLLIMKCKSKKIEWNEEEDNLICALVKRYGTKKWSKMSQELNHTYGGREKSGKQCRQRWYNHLDPNISKKQWTRFQQDLLFSLHKQHGNKWTIIAEKLQGRNDNSIKNHFYSTIRKSLRRINKFLGSKNSTLKVQKIKSLTLTKLFCLTGQDQKILNSPLKISEFSQELRSKELAYHLINFSRNKLTDQKSVVAAQDMKKLQKLLHELNTINDIYQKQIVQNQKIKSIKGSIHSEQSNLKVERIQERSKRIKRDNRKIKSVKIQQNQEICSFQSKHQLPNIFNLHQNQQQVAEQSSYFIRKDDDISKYIGNHPLQEFRQNQSNQKKKNQYNSHTIINRQILHLEGYDFFIQMPEQNYSQVMLKFNSPWITMTPGLITPSERKNFTRTLDQSVENHQGCHLRSENIEKEVLKRSNNLSIQQQLDIDMNNYDTKQNNKEF